MEAGAASNVHPIRQLSLDPGGATVDTSTIASLTWAAGTQDLDTEFKKGSDVRITMVCRVTGTPFDDKYDGHGNIAETIRGHKLRVDDVESIELVNPRAYKTRAEAKAEEEADGDGDDGAVGGGEPAPPPAEDAAPAEEPATEPEPEADPFATS